MGYQSPLPSSYLPDPAISEIWVKITEYEILVALQRSNLPVS
jgi:hypothetical protein